MLQKAKVQKGHAKSILAAPTIVKMEYIVTVVVSNIGNGFTEVKTTLADKIRAVDSKWVLFDDENARGASHAQVMRTKTRGYFSSTISTSPATSLIRHRHQRDAR